MSKGEKMGKIGKMEENGKSERKWEKVKENWKKGKKIEVKENGKN